MSPHDNNDNNAADNSGSEEPEKDAVDEILNNPDNHRIWFDTMKD